MQVAVLFFCMLALVGADQQNPVPSDVQYFLFTRANPSQAEIISYTDATINPFYDGAKRNYFIAHGFSESVPGSSWMTTMKDLILGKEDANVILVDWSILAADPRYDLAAPNTFFAGSEVATLITYLQTEGNLDPANSHGIGFSLGGQVMGVIGSQIVGMDRITGLDPAAPLFESADNAHSIEPSDASFVDILHTNAGLLVTGHLGMFEQRGHVDFYPNGGRDQRGCTGLVEEIVVNLANLTLDQINACSHGRGPEFFIQSLQDENFLTYPCADYGTYQDGVCISGATPMGFGAVSANTGSFYVETLAGNPFIANQIETSVELGTTENVRGDFSIFITVPGIEEDEFVIFGNLATQAPGAIITKILVSDASGVESLGLQLSYEKGGTGPDVLNIAAINTQDIETGALGCMGTNIDVPTGTMVPISATSGAC